MRLLLPAAIALALTLAAAISIARSEAPTLGDIAVTSAWARATPPRAEVGAAYLTIENRGAAEDRLLRVESPMAKSVELHEGLEENGVARMRPVENQYVPPGGALAMRPGGAHLMLMGLSAPLKEGDTLPLTLTFERAGQVSVAATIAGIGATAAAAPRR